METKATEATENTAITKVISEVERRFAQQVVLAGQFLTKAKAVTITDATTLSMATQAASEGKGYFNVAEEKRKKYKADYLAACNAIDGTAKKVTGPLSEGVELIRVKIATWNAAEEKKKQDALNELQAKKVFLDNIIAQIGGKADAANTPQACQDLIDSINAKFPAHEAFGPYANAAAAEKKRYLDLLMQKKQTLEKVIAGSKGSLDKIAELNAAIKDTAAASASTSATTETQQSILSEQVIENTAKSNTRKTPKAEVVDINKLPKAWLMANMEVINEYLKTLDKTKFPVEISGVKFFMHESVVIR